MANFNSEEVLVYPGCAPASKESTTLVFRTTFRDKLNKLGIPIRRYQDCNPFEMVTYTVCVKLCCRVIMSIKSLSREDCFVEGDLNIVWNLYNIM